MKNTDKTFCESQREHWPENVKKSMLQELFQHNNIQTYSWIVITALCEYFGESLSCLLHGPDLPL